MMGKTHAVTAAALALAVLRPDSVPMLAAGSVAALMGGITADMDTDSSLSHKGANGVVLASILLPLAAVAAEYFFHIGMLAYLVSANLSWRNALGAVLFIVLCAVGRTTAHRTVMHSLAALVVMTGCVGWVFPGAAPYFGIGYACHLLLDLFNRKGMQMFFPFKKRVCFNWCRADGLTNMLLFRGGTVLFILLVIVLGVRAWPSWHPVRDISSAQGIRQVMDMVGGFGK